MADWDANSPELLHNLLELGRKVAGEAAHRAPLSSEVVRAWQSDIMRGLEPTEGEPFGAFRGESGLEDYDIAVGGHYGAPVDRVRDELNAFDRLLAQQLDVLDRMIRPKRFPEDGAADKLNAVLILCAWAHGEWLRIHPFPNGNGRTARILVNAIALRYGLPAFLRIRPRPGHEYEWVASQAMERNWQAAIPTFQRMYQSALGG